MSFTFIDPLGNDTELWKAEGLIGGTSRELFLSNNGSNGVSPASAEWTWTKGIAYEWRLVWDGDIARFTLFNGALDQGSFQTLIYDTVNTEINSLQLSTRVDGRDTMRVGAGTTANLLLTTLNGQEVRSLNVAANTDYSAGVDQWTRIFVASREFLSPFTLTGSITFTWDSLNPQSVNAGSRVLFQLEANYSPDLVLENQPPTDIELSPMSVAENHPGAVIGQLTTTDADVGDRHTYTLLQDESGLFEIRDNLLKLKAGVAANFEADSTYAITVESRDRFNATIQKSFTLSITDENEAPTLQTLLPDRSIRANVLTRFSLDGSAFVDEDVGDTLTWSASLANGGALPTWLQFNAATRQFLATPPQTIQGNLEVKVTVSDRLGLSASEQFTLSILPAPPAPPTPPPPRSIIGTPSRDWLTGTSGHDQIWGLNGSDRLFGAQGNDRIEGGNGNDQLFGQDGADVLIGGKGRDRLRGGGDKDIFVIGRRQDIDQILDFRDRQDQIGLFPGLRFRTLQFTQQQRHTLISADGEPLALLKGIRPHQLSAVDFLPANQL